MCMEKKFDDVHPPVGLSTKIQRHRQPNHYPNQTQSQAQNAYDMECGRELPLP